jgi:hypothetical protein
VTRRVYDVRPLVFEGKDAHSATDELRLRLDQSVTGLMASADQERGEVDWATLTLTVERHAHDGRCVLRASASLRP